MAEVYARFVTRIYLFLSELNVIGAVLSPFFSNVVLFLIFLIRQMTRVLSRIVARFSLLLDKRNVVGATSVTSKAHLPCFTTLSPQVAVHPNTSVPKAEPSPSVKKPKPPLFTFHSNPEFSSKSDMQVSHMIQVFSVSIYTDFHDERPCDIYGSISVVDNHNITSNLYDRTSYDPETILKCGNLSLIDERSGYISCGEGTATMDLNIKDRTRNVVVINGQLDLHSETTEEIEECCDKLLKAIVKGEHGFALVYYSKFLHAVTAAVRVEVFSKHDTSCPTVDVYGSVVAEYAKARLFCNNDDEVKQMQCTLFKQPSDQKVQAVVGSSVSLSRWFVAVPAYSPLIIEAHLWDSHGVFASGSAEFPAFRHCDYHQLIDGERGFICVWVRWGDGLRIAGHRDTEKIKNVVARSKIPDGCYQYITSSSPWRNVSTIPEALEYRGCDVTEVFSVYVRGINHKVDALCGMIQVNDHNSSPWNLFERNLENAEMFTGGQTIASIQGHASLDNCEVFIKLCLNDPVNDLEISRGSISWREGGLYDMSGTYSLYGTGLSSLVRGAHGYAVVHYAIFEEACRAVVEISLVCDSPSAFPANIHGCIFASYSTYEYPTNYHRKYFRSRLFDKSETESVQLTSHTRIPLSKSVVVVPIDASLVIELDLEVNSIGNPDDTLYGKEELKIDLTEAQSKKIYGKLYYVEVSTRFVEI